MGADAALRYRLPPLRLGVKEVALIGGEFYLRDDWDHIAAEIVRAGMLCSLVSGERQLTPARTQLRKPPFLTQPVSHLSEPGQVRNNILPVGTNTSPLARNERGTAAAGIS